MKKSSSVFKQEFLDFFETNEICINNINDLIEQIEDIYFDNLIGNIKQNFNQKDDEKFEDDENNNIKNTFKNNKKIKKKIFEKSLIRIIFRYLNDLNEDENIFDILDDNKYLFDEFDENEYNEIKKIFNNKILAKNCLSVYNYLINENKTNKKKPKNQDKNKQRKKNELI
jgi:hypothetical protein